ncbi:MAG TPA: ribonucleotide-diphosphate reductase subunit beta [Thermoleophilaceae bacterium]|nr:ribonucleotide-diphosphate reductase subunit beta [Thermoleophilaceae bacterium]
MLQRVSYDDLYRRWEKGNWSATEIDFDEDRRQWHEDFSELERQAALWNYAMFLHGEDSVADNLSPFIDAAPREEHKYFLATQQVDEARHAVFFGRFMREVVENGESYAGSLEATRPQLTWGFKKVFARLDQMADELRRDRSRTKLAQGIALYHIVIEASLAQPGQHFIESYLEERGILPGFRSGMANVALDEQRHIGFGVKLLSDLVEEDPECRDAVAELLREMFPFTAAVFVPPNWDRRYSEVFGFTIEEIFAEGMRSMETKMRSAGMPLEQMPAMPIRFDLSVEERVRSAIVLLQAGVLGEKNGPVSREPEVLELLFDSLRTSVDPRHSHGRPTTIQWDFSDAEPWYLHVENGDASVSSGHAANADLTFRCRYEDWVDVMGGRADPRLLMLKGKLRPRGNPMALWRMQKLFGR